MVRHKETRGISQEPDLLGSHDRYADEIACVQDRLPHRLAYPPGRVRREAMPFARIVPGLHAAPDVKCFSKIWQMFGYLFVSKCLQMVARF